MKQARALAFALLLAAGPAAAQSSGCVRDATGALQCGVGSAPSGVNSNIARRAASTRDLSAAALARSRAQAQAMREAADQQRQDSDTREAQRRDFTCPASPPSASQAHPRPCGD